MRKENFAFFRKKAFKSRGKCGIIKKNLAIGSRVYGRITLGVSLMALGLNWFLIPNRIVVGGVSGFATVLHYLLGWPVGIVLLGVNIPLIWLGFWKLGRSYMIRTGYATILLSVLTDATSGIMPMSRDAMVCSLYGGAALGLGMGLVFSGAACTGGTDLIAGMLRQRFPHMSLGKLVLFVDAAVILFAMVAFQDSSAGLYAFLALVINSRMVDLWLEGVNFRKQVWIISSAPEVLKQRITNELQRGVTVLHGFGGYTMTPKQILLCAISKREIVRLKQFVQQADPAAFVIITDAREVVGAGFE